MIQLTTLTNIAWLITILCSAFTIVFSILTLRNLKGNSEVERRLEAHREGTTPQKWKMDEANIVIDEANIVIETLDDATPEKQAWLFFRESLPLSLTERLEAPTLEALRKVLIDDEPVCKLASEISAIDPRTPSDTLACIRITAEGMKHEMDLDKPIGPVRSSQKFWSHMGLLYLVHEEAQEALRLHAKVKHLDAVLPQVGDIADPIVRRL